MANTSENKALPLGETGAELTWEEFQTIRAAAGALHLIEALAVFDGDQYELHNRVAVHDNAYWLDLTDEKSDYLAGSVACVTRSGWKGSGSF